MIICESDIKEILKLLRNALKTADWDLVQEANEYLEDFSEDPVADEDE